MVATQGAVTPVTTPVALTVAQGLLLDQEFPGVGSVSTIVCPAQTDEAPEMGAGVAYTVTGYVVKPPPEKL